MHGLFVTGTDTDVGKTYHSAQIVRQLRAHGHRVGAYKPVCSGAVPDTPHSAGRARIWGDLESLWMAVGTCPPKEWVCPQTFVAPFAPPVAAKIENKSVDEQLLSEGLQVWEGKVDTVVVEGVGGWKCPISSNLMVADLAEQFKFPVVIVAANRLGVINHTLLTIDAIRATGLTVAGVILNIIDSDPQSAVTSTTNAEQILQFCELPFLAIAAFESHAVLRCHQTSCTIDWEQVIFAGKSEAS